VSSFSVFSLAFPPARPETGAGLAGSKGVFPPSASDDGGKDPPRLFYPLPMRGELARMVSSVFPFLVHEPRVLASTSHPSGSPYTSFMRPPN